MRWSDLFNAEQMPDRQDIRAFLGESAPLWDDLLTYLETAYTVKPQSAYSKCSAQPGWNVKYKKSSKSLCTLYPMPGYFIALVVVGAKEEDQVQMMSAGGAFTPYVTALYAKTPFSAGGRWLMIEVRDQAVLNDVKALIAIRVRPKK